MSKLFVISAPSGAGKTTLIESLLEHSSKRNLRLGISCTTRSKRKNETNGESYFFKTKEEFQEMSEKEELLESAEVFGNFYGTPREWVLNSLSNKENVILELDIQGALQVKEAFPDTRTIFIIPPSYDDLSSRLSKRAQDSQEEIKKRLKEAKKEVEIGKKFDQIIVNDNFSLALEDLKKFIFTEEGLTEERGRVVDKSLNLLLD